VVRSNIVAKWAHVRELPYTLVRGQGDRYHIPLLRQGLSPVIKLSLAARMLRLSTKTLLRVEQRKIIRLIVVRQSGRLYVNYNELIKVPFLGFGQVARIIGCRYEAIRTMLRQRMGQGRQKRYRISLLEGYWVMNRRIRPQGVHLWLWGKRR